MEQELTHACGFIGVRTPNDCKSDPIDTPRWSLLKPKTLKLLPWKWEDTGHRSGSLTMIRKMKTSYDIANPRVAEVKLLFSTSDETPVWLRCRNDKGHEPRGHLEIYYPYEG
ncbi:uncharacterized protein LOC126614061 isoform X2 [Malus sylvestris]|nr:uncharacterized protein LOC126614061 isoform X2 [Malus sylvestris]